MTDKGIELIKYFEGCKLEAYKCPAGKWTIGIGATYYTDGTPVKQGDKLKSVEEAEELLKKMLKTYEDSVDRLVTSKINPYQRDALISFTYNLGANNLGRSTLLKKVNVNPNDPTIKDEFVKWVNAGGKFLKGLLNRRKAEVELYFSPYNETAPISTNDGPRGPFYPSQESKKDITWLYKYDPSND